MAEHRENIELKVDDNFLEELRRNVGNIRRAVLEFDSHRNDDLVSKIDAISGDDPECAHGELDGLLEATFPDEVRAAIQRLKDRCSWWAGA